MHRPLGLTTIRSSEYPVFSCGGGEGGERRPTSTRGRSASSVSSPSVASPLAQCQALRGEARRLWTDLVTLLTQSRSEGRWLSAWELEQATKGGQYALHSQSVQALCQKFAATVATATELRRQEREETGQAQTQSPHHGKPYQTVIWKDQAHTVLPAGSLRLPTGA